MKMIKLDYDQHVHETANTKVIDFDHVRNWQSGPTSEAIVN